MTVIEGLARLETPALWRPEPGAQRRDVYVAIGEAELVIQAPNGTALTHWSLPALIRVNPGERPALYAPSRESDEELQVDDGDMIEALERVEAAVSKTKTQPGRLRRISAGLLITAALVLGAVWLPGALRDQAAALLPEAKARQIGQEMLDAMSARSGGICGAPVGLQALDRLRLRLMPDRAIRLVVLADLPHPAIALPGDIVALSEAALIAQDDPAIAAGHIVAAAQASATEAPLESFLEGLTLTGTLRLLTEGEIAPGSGEQAAERAIATGASLPPDDALRAAFADAGLAWRPWAEATGRDTADAALQQSAPVLNDGTWQRLRGICDS